VMHTGSITDFDQDAFAAQREGVRATSRNQLQFAMNDLMGLVAESATTKLALQNGTMEVEEAVDILQDAKSDVHRLLQEEGTLGNLGMKLEDVNARMNILINTARESYKEIKSEKINAFTQIVQVTLGRVQLREAQRTLGMSDVDFAFMQDIDTILKVSQAQKSVDQARHQQSVGNYSTFINYLANAGSWGLNRRNAKTSIDEAAGVKQDTSKAKALYTALGKIKAALDEHPDLAPHAEKQMPRLVEFAKGLSTQFKETNTEEDIKTAMRNMFQSIGSSKKEAGRRQGERNFNDAAAVALADVLSQAANAMQKRKR
jgi:hypothetical protein